MRVPGLPSSAEFGDCPHLAGRNEHGVETEAFMARRPERDRALERARATCLAPVWSDGDELTDVAGRPIRRSFERFERSFDMQAVSPAGSPDTGQPPEGGQLDTGVLAEHPVVHRSHLPTVLGFCARVLEECLADLGRIAI